MSQQYFETQPSVASDPKRVGVTIDGFDYVFVTDRGVFSYEKIDKATRLLLEVFSEKYYGPNPQTIVDVGAGYGPISVVMANKFLEAKIFGIEPNERARNLAIENYRLNIGDDRFQCVDTDQTASIKADLIISNPPVRVGKKELYELLSYWAQKLNPNGQMWLVIAKNLGADSASAFLETQCNLEVKRVASKKGFRIFCCKKPA